MLLVPRGWQRRDDDHVVRRHDRRTAGVVSAVARGGGISTTKTTRSLLAIGAALSSLPVAMGRLVQFGVGRVVGVVERGGGDVAVMERSRRPPSRIATRR
jgi:hypothetical protein